MVFSSLPFMFLFLPVFMACTLAVPKTWRNTVLFVFSLLFYAWGEPVYVLLMLFSTAVDYAHGRAVNRFLGLGDKKRAKLFVLSSVCINLALLGFFKYADFITGGINSLIGTSIPMLNLPLPIGISFYTFQTMSYTIDIYRGKAPVQKNIISFGAYVAMFPQLIAGPIVQYNQVAKELDSRTVTLDGFSQGVWRFSIGLGKKVLLANSIGSLWDKVSASDASSLTAATAWLGIIAYAFQIYFDFSGYSDMAVGLGKMLGFEFPENFRHPYQADSVTDFWRRWHISLGSWFRDYVYIPLGGNRNGIARQLRNIAVVWLLTGLWHGASLNFAFWGIYFAVLLIIEKLFLLKLLDKLPKFFGRIYTLFVVLISWVIFAFDDFSRGWAYIRAMFASSSGLYDRSTLLILATYGVTLAVLCIACTDLPARAAAYINKHRSPSLWLTYSAKGAACASILVLSTAYLVNSGYNPFLYFRF